MRDFSMQFSMQVKQQPSVGHIENPDGLIEALGRGSIFVTFEERLAQ